MINYRALIKNFPCAYVSILSQKSLKYGINELGIKKFMIFMNFKTQIKFALINKLNYMFKLDSFYYRISSSSFLRYLIFFFPCIVNTHMLMKLLIKALYCKSFTAYNNTKRYLISSLRYYE